MNHKSKSLMLMAAFLVVVAPHDGFGQIKIMALKKAFSREGFKRGLKKELKEKVRDETAKKFVEKIFDDNETINLITDVALTCNPPLNPQCIFLGLTSSSKLGDPNKKGEQVRQSIGATEKLLAKLLPVWKAKKIALVKSIKQWEADQTAKRDALEKRRSDLQKKAKSYRDFATKEVIAIGQGERDLKEKIRKYNDWLKAEQAGIQKAIEAHNREAKEAKKTIEYYLRHFKQAAKTHSGAKRNSAVRHHNHLAKTGELLEEVPGYLVGSIRNIWAAKIARPHNAQYRRIKASSKAIDDRTARFRKRVADERAAITKAEADLKSRTKRLDSRRQELDALVQKWQQDVQVFEKKSNEEFKKKFEKGIKAVRAGESLIRLGVMNLHSLNQSNPGLTRDVLSKWQYELQKARDEIRAIEKG